jgi:hypothetical protein
VEPSGNPKSVNAGKLVETLVSRFETRNYFAMKKRKGKRKKKKRKKKNYQAMQEGFW